MKAVRLHAYGGVDQFHYEEVSMPEPGPDEVLIKVAATSINPVDWKIRSGALKEFMPITFPAILGRDVAGTVEKTGENVRTLKVGQKVIGMVFQAYAEYLTAPAKDLTVLPDGLNLEDSAALPVVATTGAELSQRIGLKRGDLLLVTGALGSVGRSAVYYAKQRGVRVIAGVRAKQKDDAISLAGEQVVAIDDDNEIAALPELDAIADTVNHDVVVKLLPRLKSGGVLVSVVGLPKEAEGKNIRAEMFGATPDASLLRQMADAVRDGHLTIPISKRMKLSDAAEAQELGEKGSVGGKILLIP